MLPQALVYRALFLGGGVSFKCPVAKDAAKGCPLAILMLARVPSARKALQSPPLSNQEAVPAAHSSYTSEKTEAQALLKGQQHGRQGQARPWAPWPTGHTGRNLNTHTKTESYSLPHDVGLGSKPSLPPSSGGPEAQIPAAAAAVWPQQDHLPYDMQV